MVKARILWTSLEQGTGLAFYYGTPNTSPVFYVLLHDAGQGPFPSQHLLFGIVWRIAYEALARAS